MQVHITARHINLTSALADYVQKKLDRVERHFPAVLRAQVILAVEKHRHIAEVVVHANGHHDFRAKGESADLYAAVDLVIEKLHKHMARIKDRRVRGRRRVAEVPPEDASLPPFASADGDERAEELPVTRVRRMAPRSMTLEEAVDEIRRLRHPFYVFSSEDLVNVLYRRRDKTYGLLELNV
jgi:putative sigma-54 modulation protein